MEFKEFAGIKAKETEQLEESYTKSAGYHAANDAINLLEKVLNPNSALCKGISKGADNVAPEFKEMQKHMNAILDLWDEVNMTIGMNDH